MSEETESTGTNPRADKPNFVTQVKFDDLNLPESVLSGLNDAGFTHCTPIQAQTLPATLAGRDVAGQAQTGTGKTAAFLITVFTRLLKRSQIKPGMSSALIIAPTRELALQIYEDGQMLGKHTGLSMALVIGGIDYHEQAEALKTGPDIVICTPGRIIDYQKQGVFKTQQIEILVIDEADRLFDLGFIKDLRFLLRRLPPYEKRQSLLFSATLSYRVLELTYEYMNLPEFISVTPEEVTLDGIEQTLYHVGREEKMNLLLGIMEREDWHRLLIFVNTKSGVEWVTRKLKGNGYPAEGITGDLPQRKRLQLMERFKDDRLKILVATDVASRGIHVEDISHVINYDLPQDPENYIHRIGRTARAGRTGRAISLACEDYVFHLEPMEELLGQQIPVVWPEGDDFVQDKAGRVSIPRKDRGRRPPDKRPRPGRRGDSAEKRSAPPAPSGRSRPKYPTSSLPGGIFGLSPRNPAHPGADTVKSAAAAPSEDEAKKKKRRRRKRKPAAADPTNGAGVNNEGLGGAEGNQDARDETPGE